MHLQENTLPTVVLNEVGSATKFPRLQLHGVPVNIIEYLITVGVHHPHVVSVWRHLISFCFRVFHQQLHVGDTISVAVTPFDDQITCPTVNAVFVSVYQETVTVGITFQIPVLHIVVIIDPKHRNAVGCYTFDCIGVAVTVKIDILNLVSYGWGRKPVGDYR